MISLLGKRFLVAAEGAGSFTLLLLNTLRAIFRPPFEWKEFIKQLELVGVMSLPVVAAACIFTGMVFSLQTYDGFARFQAESYVPGILGVALLRELAPVMGGMMMAGRVGSAMAAELGTMKVTNQIAALEVMATDPIQFLVLPRFLAAAVMLPLLIIIGDLLGLLGGWYLIAVVLDAPIPSFMARVFEFLSPEDFWSGIIKSFFFGCIVASVGCYHGLNTRGGAQGVGKATTSAVVIASLSILVCDFVLSKVMF